MSHIGLLSRPVVVLDSRWVPINLISARKALSLLLNSDAQLRSKPASRSPPYGGYRAMWLNLSDMSTHSTASEWAVTRLQRGNHHTCLERQSGLENGYVASPNLQIRVPYAIVLTKPGVSMKTNKALGFSRRAVLERDSYRCGYCGSFANTIDHVLPRARGGETSYVNCVACCAPCNERKGSENLQESSMQLRKNIRLEQPDRSFFTRLRIVKYSSYWAALLRDSSATKTTSPQH